MLSLVRSRITDSTRYVITPETYTFQFNLDCPQTNVTYNGIEELLQDYPQSSFILGAITYRLFPSKAVAPYNARPVGSQWYCSYNTAMMIDTTGMRNFYHKSKLVPAVEILPYQRYLGFLGKVFELFGGSMSSYGVSDDVNNLTDRDGGQVGVMICYESIYGEYYRRTAKYGAGFTAVITNDGWWGDTPGYRQHLSYACLRAIETRRDIVRCANTGISALINQRGDVLSETDWWTREVLTGTVSTSSRETFFVRCGDIVGRVCTYLFLLIALALLLRLFIRR
jgi:apolipoprotein N-acyltransferase